MGVCDQLEPKRVFHYFEEICGIPHGSGNMDEISNYCAEFAKDHRLQYHKDAYGNLILRKKASEGYEGAEPVIIQGHLDMVCEKESGVEIDFAKDGLELYVEGDFLRARGTTLGGDDGIAVAYALALLEDEALPHPPLEVVLTVDEEIGLLGAEKIDLSMLRGRKLLNLDSDEEGIFFVSCAGGLLMECRIPMAWTEKKGKCYEVKVLGLQGGHSGTEIQKERGNAIILLGRVLEALRKDAPFSIVSMKGGMMDNAIPREASCMILLEGVETRLQEAIARIRQELKQEYRRSDPGLELSCEEAGAGTKMALLADSQAKALFFLRMMPWGVQHMSAEIGGLVETSLNPGIMALGEEDFSVCSFIRSSVNSRKYEVAGRLSALTEFLGGTASASSDYPAWEYKADSPVQELMAAVYRDLFGKEAQIQAIHAGLECGIFSGKLEGLDCISFGPDNFDIHTPKEHLSISSTERVWRLILEFLKRSR